MKSGLLQFPILLVRKSPVQQLSQVVLETMTTVISMMALAMLGQIRTVSLPIVLHLLQDILFTLNSTNSWQIATTGAGRTSLISPSG